jgi:hypothetical protein
MPIGNDNMHAYDSDPMGYIDGLFEIGMTLERIIFLCSDIDEDEVKAMLEGGEGWFPPPFWLYGKRSPSMEWELLHWYECEEDVEEDADLYKKREYTITEMLTRPKTEDDFQRYIMETVGL